MESTCCSKPLGQSAELALERVDLFERDGRSALEERERQLAQAQRLAHFGSWEWHFSTGRVVWSEEMYRIYDLDPAALEGDADYSWFRARSHPEDRLAMEEAVKEALSSGDPFQIDHRLVMPDGQVKWLHCRGRVVFDDDGTPAWLQGTAQEITAGKQAEEQLKTRAHQQAAVAHDGLGHSAGDELLRVVAHRLVEAVRPGDTVARFGGDEFVVLCEDLPGEEAAVALAGRVADTLSHPVTIAGRKVAITASIGIVVADAALASPEELLRDADTAMYQAKERGRARHEVFDAPARKRVMDRLDTEVALRRALERGEFRLWYQPEVALGETLRRLRGLGVRLAIDDFGTGFSSLSWLRSMSSRWTVPSSMG